jgi:hypothetical protein
MSDSGRETGEGEKNENPRWEKIEAKRFLSVVLWRARQLGLSYNLAEREDDPDNYKSIQSRDGIDRIVVRSKTRRGG